MNALLPFVRQRHCTGISDALAYLATGWEYQGQGLRIKTRTDRRLRGAVTALSLLCTAHTLSGCAAKTYAGIPLASGVADPQLQLLANRAQAGDKQAQLELGIAFEEGRGVSVDFKRAIKLYRMAASDSGGPVWIYSPPVGNGTKGRVLKVDAGARMPGLAEAKTRLALLEAIPDRY